MVKIVELVILACQALDSAVGVVWERLACPPGKSASTHPLLSSANSTHVVS